jgi:ASPIC and UnbV
MVPGHSPFSFRVVAGPAVALVLCCFPSSDPRPHFGLGAATSIDKLEIMWPDGANEQVKVGAVDRIVTIEEGRGIVQQ